MRKMGLLASAAALAVGGSMAKADFVISFQTFDLGATNTVTSDPNSNGTMPGFDMILLYAKNNGVNGTGTKLSSENFTLTDHTAANNLVIGGYAVKTPTPTSQAELVATSGYIFPNNAVIANSTGYSFAGNTKATGSPSYYTSETILGSPTVTTDDSAASVTAPTQAGNTFATLGFAAHSIAMPAAGDLNGNGGADATTSNGGLGALFAVVVLPHGDAVDYSGVLGGNLGSPSTLLGSTAVPEPMTAGLFGIGLAGLAARRRRQA
jgi:hypothetical protein